MLFPSFFRGEKLQNFPGFAAPPRYATFFPILPNMQHFPNHCSMQIFLTSGIGPDILMRVFEGYIILLISGGQLLFDFYLKQKQRFSVLSFTEITSFISFNEVILSITKNTKKCSFQLANFKYNKNRKQKLKQNLLTQNFLTEIKFS